MAGWNYSLGSPSDDNTIWGSMGRGLSGIAQAFADAQRVKQSQDQQAFQDLQTKLKMFPTVDDTTKRQWIDAYQQQVGKNKFWDKGAFQWPTQPGQTQGQPNFMGPAVPPAPGAQTGGTQPSGIPSPFVNPNAAGQYSPMGAITPGSPGSIAGPSQNGQTPQMQTAFPPLGAGAPTPAVPAATAATQPSPPAPAPGTSATTPAPYTQGTRTPEYMLPGATSANRPLAEAYPAGTPTGDALRKVVPANLLSVPRDQLPPETQTQVDEVIKRVTVSAFRSPVNLADFVTGYRIRGGADNEPNARAFISSLEARVNDGSMTVSEAVAEVQKSPLFISPSADAARFTTRVAGVTQRIQKLVDDATTLAKTGNPQALAAAKRKRDQAAQQLQVANDALAKDDASQEAGFQGLPIRMPDDQALEAVGAAQAHTTAREDLSQGAQVGPILDKVRRGIPITPGEQRVLNTVHPPRQPRAGTGPVGVTEIPTPGAGGGTQPGGASYRVVTKRDGSKQYQMSIDGKNFGDIPFSEYQAAVNIGKAPWQNVGGHTIRVVPQPDGSTKTQENLGNGVIRNLSDDEARAILGSGKPTTKRLQGPERDAAYQAAYNEMLAAKQAALFIGRDPSTGQVRADSLPHAAIAKYIKDVTGPTIGKLYAEAVAEVKSMFPNWAPTSLPGPGGAGAPSSAPTAPAQPTPPAGRPSAPGGNALTRGELHQLAVMNGKSDAEMEQIVKGQNYTVSP